MTENLRQKLVFAATMGVSALFDVIMVLGALWAADRGSYLVAGLILFVVFVRMRCEFAVADEVGALAMTTALKLSDLYDTLNRRLP